MARCSTTVVIPAYRAEKTLRRAAASSLADGAPRRVFVVFDGPDPSAETTLARLPGVESATLPRVSGAPACRNRGWTLADTPFVLFLDADDYLEGPLLASAEAEAEATGADIVFAPFAFEYPGPRRRLVDPQDHYPDIRLQAILRRWLKGRFTPPCGLLWRRAFLERIGGWDESLAKNQDGDLMFRALLAGPRVAFSRQGRGVYVQDDDPARITRRCDRRALASQLRALDKLRARLDETPLDVLRELAGCYYDLARLAYTHAADDIGSRAEANARALGLRGQPGGWVHTLPATIFGLRGKQRLVKFLREASSAPVRGVGRAARFRTP